MSKTTLADLKNTTVAKDTFLAESAVATHAVVRESPVDILFMIEGRSDVYDLRSDTERRIIRVKVWAKHKADLFSYTDIKVPGKSQNEMARACEFAAAALAERHHVLYGTGHEPYQCAMSAKKHFNELCDYLQNQAA